MPKENFPHAADGAAQLRILRRKATLDVANFSTRLALADALSEMGAEDEALIEYHSAFAIACLSLPLPTAAPAELADRLVELAGSLQRSGNQEMARLAAERALAIKPFCAEALILVEGRARALEKADILRRQGRLGDAAALYQRLLDEKPDDVSVLHGLSAALRDLSRYAEALPFAERALALAPGDPWRQVQLGNLLRKLDRREEAVAAYQAALAISFNLPGVPESLGRLLLELGRDGEAIEQLALAAAEHPREAGLMAEVAELCLRAGRPCDAVPWFRRALAGGWQVEERLNAALNACHGPRQAARSRFRLAEDLAGDVELWDALRRLPFPGEQPVHCSRLTGGFQNTLYRLKYRQGEFALRTEKFPPIRWDFYSEERHNAVLAHGAGLTAEVLFYDPADGTMLSRFIGGQPLDYQTVLQPRVLAEAGALYGRLHALGDFRGEYDIFRMIDKDVARRRTGANLGIEDLGRSDAWFAKIRSALMANVVPAAPCHNDPVPQNFIDAQGGLLLLDWQCSGQNDPHWELGAFCAQMSLSPAQEEIFLRGHFGEIFHPGADRVRLYRAVCHYFWLNRNLAGDTLPTDAVLAEAVENLQKFHAVVANEAFAGILERVAALRWSDVVHR